MNPNNIDKVKLKNLIETYFTLEELKTLCFEMDIPYESLPGPMTINVKTRELIDYCGRNGCLDNLIEKLYEERSHVDWSVVIIIVEQKNSDGQTEKKPTQSEHIGVRKRSQTHFVTIIIVNIIFFIIFLFLIVPRAIETYLPDFIFCSSDKVTVTSLSIITILTLHLLWRILPLSHQVGGNIKFFGLVIPVGSVQSVINSVHPWGLSDRIFLGTVFPIIVVALFFLTPRSPLNGYDSIPRLAYYSITMGIKPLQLPIGQTLQLQKGQEVTIKPVIGVIKGLNCEWKSPPNGVITKIDGCTVSYVAPQFEDIDFLEMKIMSKCSNYILISAIVVDTSKP